MQIDPGKFPNSILIFTTFGTFSCFETNLMYDPTLAEYINAVKILKILGYCHSFIKL